MALGDFYTQVILIALGASGILYAMAKKRTDTIDKLEDSLSQEGYLIQSHIWGTNIKSAVEDLVSFVQGNIAESESEDEYIELFSDKEKISSLKNRLTRLNELYNAYLDFNNLFPSLIREYEESKKWLIRTIVVCFAFASWGAIGFLLETEVNLLKFFKNIFWFIFCLVAILLAFSVYKIILHNRKSGSVKVAIRTEKSKYGDVLEKVV